MRAPQRGEASAPDWALRSGNPYLEGLFAPVPGETSAEDLPVEGELPRELSGVFVRNGPNPAQPPRGRYHWFDGDGMLHAVEFAGGRASYRCRWIGTAGLAAERSAGRALWPGYMDPPDAGAPAGSGSDGWLKDTANTDVVFHAGSLLALWYQCGAPLRVDPRSLATLGPESFGGRLPRRMSAHAKVDPATGELVFFDYATRPPYLVLHVASAQGELLRSVEVPLPGPRLPHDMAITRRFALLMDLPLFWDPELLRRGAHRLDFHPELPSRFAVVPRREPGAIRWFEAQPTYIYHVANAWEEGDAIVMDAFRVVDPGARRRVGDGPLSRMLGTLLLDARLRRWRFDLVSGRTHEQDLDDRNAEFPSIDADRLGEPTRFLYAPTIADGVPTLLFDGIAKYDTRAGSRCVHRFGPGRYGSEAPFARRPGARDEDDGWLVSFVCDERENRSEVWVLDARDLAAPPVARVRLPARVPIGFHACFVPGHRLEAR